MKLQTNLKELEELLKTEQQNVKDVKLKIEEYKAKMAAQNKEIAQKQADKEQRETLVCFSYFSKITSFINKQ